MAIRVVTRVWDGYHGGGSELLALLALADWSDDEGRCWPSMPSIARKVRLQEKQARRVVHALIEAGFVTVTNFDAGGAASRRYQINLHRLTPPVEGSPPLCGSPPADDRNPSPGREATPPLEGSRTVIDTSLTTNSLPTAKADRPLEQVDGKKSKAACPHQEIIAAYHDAIPTSPRIRDWTPARATLLRNRWNEDPTRQNLDYWRRLFAYVAESGFLTGKVSTPGRKPFTASLEWLLKPENFAKVREGRYHGEAEQ